MEASVFTHRKPVYPRTSDPTFDRATSPFTNRKNLQIYAKCRSSFLRLVCADADHASRYDDVDGVSFVEYCTTQNFSTSFAGRSINSSEANVKVGQHFVGDDHVVVNVVGDHHRAT